MGAPKFINPCEKCGGAILPTKRSDSRFCSVTCRKTAEKARFCKRYPDYVKRQRRQVSEIRHLKDHGHLEYLENPEMNKKDKFGAARKLGYRSMLEVAVAKQLEAAGVDYKYETIKIKYTQPETVKTYTPDMILPNGIIVETKGRFVVADRKKHLLVQQQYPDLDIRFVFSNSKTKISKGSKTSYADWCNKNGFTFADKEVPEQWFKL